MPPPFVQGKSSAKQPVAFNPIQQALIAQEAKKYFSKLSSLFPRDGLLVDLSYRRGLPPEEIAAILNVSVGAIYTQKSRILDKLRETLRKTGSL